MIYYAIFLRIHLRARKACHCSGGQATATAISEKESRPAASRLWPYTPPSDRVRSALLPTSCRARHRRAEASRVLGRGACRARLYRCIHDLLREDLTMPRTFPVPAVPGCHIRPRRWPVALLVGLALSLGMIIETQAATTWTVCASGCDYSSIKAAIAAPTTVDGDTLAIAAGTYTEPGITVTKSLTLQGEAAATTIVQAAATPTAATDRVFTIPQGVTMSLQDLTIRYGRTDLYNPAGGGLYNAGTLTLTRSTVSGNSTVFGGGLFNDNEGTLTITQSTVSSNSTSDYGGGLYN